jgi:hypothetical protein
MTDKHKARLAYLDGARAAMVAHFDQTVKGLGKLKGMSEKETEKLVSAVRKKHEKLVDKLDRQIAVETRKTA